MLTAEPSWQVHECSLYVWTFSLKDWNETHGKMKLNESLQNCIYNHNYTVCYRLNVPPQNMLKPNLLRDGIWRWSLWEVIRSWEWSPHDWGVPRELPPSLLPCKDTGRQHLRARKWALTKHQICQHLYLGPSSLWNCEK